MHTRAIRCFVLAGLFWAAVFPAAAQTSTVRTPQARTELLVHAPEGVAPGKQLWAGWRINHNKHWHSYWRNPGDSGLPTELQWSLPEGIEAGPIEWPVPQKIPVGPLVNYGYEGTVLLTVPLTVTPAFRPAPGQRDITIRLQASWLICREECIPQEGRYALRVPLKAATSRHAAAFEEARRALPQALLTAQGSALIAGDKLQLTVTGLPAALHGRQIEVFSEIAEVVNPSAPWTQSWDGAKWHADLPLAPQRSASPAVLPVVFAHGGQGWRAEFPVSGDWTTVMPGAAAAAVVSSALQAALDANLASARAPVPAAPSAPPLSIFWLALGGALLGGLILNLMPCVLPVLAVKVLSFSNHAHDARRLRTGGIAYTAGVIVSFLALGLGLLALRAAGEGLGWGFQLQQPLVVATLALLFTLLALNLFGVFEFRQFVPSSLAGLQLRHPAADSFLTGVLAVAVASPCTAPFMGAALGAALTLPALQGLAVFFALGLGLALPYLVISFVPALGKRLPAPGPWMLTLKRILAIPMLLTAFWLVWVLGQQSALMAQDQNQGTDGTVRVASSNARWQSWSPERERQLLAEGRAVFVDYTAAWCVTCQVNKLGALSDAAVLRAFEAKNVALLRADWTRRDETITQALRNLGRSGVPVYVLQRTGRAPVVLSEFLSRGDVQRALATL